MINTVYNKCCTTVRDVRISLGSDKAGVFTLPSLFYDPVDPLAIAYGETSLIRHSMGPENSVRLQSDSWHTLV